ncbi:MAG: hypothetical protein KF878_10740 [Planctomycetes bacterium]|nr:hypothetical protein [Planctomycetota bacterium]
MGATVLLCVTGSIAAYKAADLASKLAQAGHEVTALMTEAARQLVSPNTFLNLTGRRVYTDLWDPQGQTEHIALTDRADLVIVAPATANTLAKIAHGLGDDMVSTTLLAVRSPVLVCPAMNTRMWAHPVVQRNLALVRALPGYHVLEPGAGHLACGHVGPGRLPEPADILSAAEVLLGSRPAPEPPLATFLELVVYDAPPPPEAQDKERAYRADLLRAGTLVSSGSLGERRRAHVHRARSLDEALERARRSPLAGSGCRIEVFPWALDLPPPP